MPIIWKGPTNGLVMQPNSPSLTYGDRVKAVDIYKGPQNLCAANMVPRGTFGTGFRAGWVCTQSAVTTDRVLIGTLTIEWEAGGAGATQPLPSGSFSMDPQEQYPKIERAAVFNGIKPETLNVCYNALNGSNTDGNPAITLDNLPTLPIFGGHGSGNTPTPTTDQTQQLALARKLLAKLVAGEETFYLAGWRYTFEIFSYTEPVLDQGGFALTGNPPGPISDFPSGVSWLRLADKVDPAGVNGSMYKTTCTYLGTPVFNGIGVWDPDIYLGGS